MFADTALAARIDRAEARLCADAARAVQESRPGSGALVRPIGGGLAIYVGPGSPANKVVGIGFEGPLDPSCLSAVEAAWRERKEPVRIELSILADPEIAPMMTGRGYRLHGFENVLGRRLDARDSTEGVNGVSIEVLDADDIQTWIDIAVEAFVNLDGTGSGADDGLQREQLERVLLDFASLPSFTRYLARIDGRPVGEANLRLDDGLAQVAGAGTLPAYRGRGVQKALLQRRLADALAAGCDFAVVTTSPGTRSQANVMRRGFELLYTRAILVKPWPDE